MGLGNFFKKLGGDTSPREAKTGTPVEHEGYTIIPAPSSEGSQWYVAGTIRRTHDGEVQEHKFIRADSHGDWDAACEHSVLKAKRMIAESGERLFRNTTTKT